MAKKILVTGGAGFIGSHVVDALIDYGNEVIILDNLDPQIHGAVNVPEYLNPKADFVKGDVRDVRLLKSILPGVEVVYHFAANTGVGQSMYQISSYLDMNITATGTILQSIVESQTDINKFILASSRAIYGEGLYQCEKCGNVKPPSRSVEKLNQGLWVPLCPLCGKNIQPLPTDEKTPNDPGSIYAMSKAAQEDILKIIGEAYQIPSVILRFFNVYGPRQALSNPYTGVISTFITRIVNGKKLQVYEDGKESRDFVHVKDVVNANILALNNKIADGKVYNVGSGNRISLFRLAEMVASLLDGPQPMITGQFRVGDVRHCFADITKISNDLGYEPKVDLFVGLSDLISSLPDEIWDDLTDKAEVDLIKRGLSKKV